MTANEARRNATELAALDLAYHVRRALVALQDRPAVAADLAEHVAALEAALDDYAAADDLTRYAA